RHRDPALALERGALLLDRAARDVGAAAAAAAERLEGAAGSGRMKLVPAGPARSPSTSRAFVEIEELSMEYEAQPGTRLLALDQVGCAIAESDFCTIVGPSGCGKSTLLMLTAGLYQPSAGQVVIGGAPVTGPWDGVGMV